MTNGLWIFRTGILFGLVALNTSCLSKGGNTDNHKLPSYDNFGVPGQDVDLHLNKKNAKLSGKSHSEEIRFSVAPKGLNARLAEPRFSHQIQKGETLSQIAKQYQTSIAAIKKVNRIRGSRIYAGQALVIPSVSVSQKNSRYPDLAKLWNKEMAELLAKESLRYGSNKNTQGHCLRGVRIALTKSLQKIGIVRFNQRLFLGRSAHHFKTWAVNNPRDLCRKYKLVPIVGNEAHPVYPGLIYVYSRGRCGFSKRYGHIETVVSTNPGIVCSDSCRNISLSSCQPDLILAPCKICPRILYGENVIERSQHISAPGCPGPRICNLWDDLMNRPPDMVFINDPGYSCNFS